MIIINGKSFSVSGNNINISGDSVIVDGKVIQSDLSGIVKIEFKGDLAKLNCNTAEVHGNVNGDVNANTVHCGNVLGAIDANTVHCHDVLGGVDANTVRCNKKI